MASGAIAIIMRVRQFLNMTENTGVRSSQVFPCIMARVTQQYGVLPIQWIKSMQCTCAAGWKWDQTTSDHGESQRTSRLSWIPYRDISHATQLSVGYPRATHHG